MHREDERTAPIDPSVHNRMMKRDVTGLQIMLSIGVACWAIAGLLASLPIGPPSLYSVFSALGQISQVFTDNFALGFIAASLALFGLTVGALGLANRDDKIYVSYERRLNLKRLALGFCWFNTGILSFAITCSFISSANSSYALELLSKSIGSEQVTTNADAEAFIVQSGIGFLLTMVLLILLALNHAAEKLALAEPVRGIV